MDENRNVEIRPSASKDILQNPYFVPIVTSNVEIPPSLLAGKVFYEEESGSEENSQNNNNHEPPQAPDNEGREEIAGNDNLPEAEPIAKPENDSKECTIPWLKILGFLVFVCVIALIIVALVK